MNWKITIFEIIILLFLLYWYIIPNWNKPRLTLSDIVIVELLYFIGFDLYKTIKRKI